MQQPTKNLQPADMMKLVKELLETLENLSKPTSPETDNHETGLWKGSAIMGSFAAIGFGVLA